MEVRYGRLHNASISVIATGMIVITLTRFFTSPDATLNVNDPRFMLNASLAGVMAFFAWQGAQRFANRTPQVVIDRDGIEVGFGRGKRFTWDQIHWVRVKRQGFRPQLQMGLEPEAFIMADLRLSQWSLDDSLRPVRGMPATLAIRDNGLDCNAAAMLDAVKSFRPNLIKS